MEYVGRLFCKKNTTVILEMLELRRRGWSYVAIAEYYGKDHSTIIYHCKKHSVVPKFPIVRAEYKKKMILSPDDIPEIVVEMDVVEIVTPKPEPKYAVIIEEKINVGKNYKDYLKERGIKMPRYGDM